MSAATTLLVVLGWSAGLVLASRPHRLDAERVHPTAAGCTTVSVVIPARDEERSLPPLLASLASQDDPPAEVIVVDDGSGDATVSVARAAGATVIIASAPPPGWAGKPWACHLGAARAGGERLVFLDADTRLAPDGLARLAAAHERRAPQGLLSVQPHHHVAATYEHLSLFANVVPALAAGLLGPAATPVSRVAFGPCLVTTATALQAVGGFAAVRGEVLEDAALARAYGRAGRTVVSLLGGRTVWFRMHPDGLRQLVEGWTRTLAGGARQASAALVAGSALWIAGLGAAAVWAARAPSPASMLAWAISAAQVGVLARRVGTCRPWAAALYPIPLLGFLVLFLRSALHWAIRRRVRWRGRDLPVPAREV